MITDRSNIVCLQKGHLEPPSELPHSQALHTHISSLAFVHALQIVKGLETKTLRQQQLQQAITSLKQSFSLNSEQCAYIEEYYCSELHIKQHYIEERFGELEEKVIELAKKRIKGKVPLAIEEDFSCDEISRLRAILQISQDVISNKIQRRTRKLAENAFLVAVRDLAVLRGYTEDSKHQGLSLEDIKVISQRQEDLELTPRLLERAVNIYERTLSRS